MIELRSIKKSYGPIDVLLGINLKVSNGEFVSVRGKSGVGKTTLVRIMGLLERPDSGRVKLSGRPVAGLGDGERSSLRLNKIGFVFQLHNLIPSLTVAENVELPLAMTGIGKKGRRERALSLLEYFGLERYGNRDPETLSGGERQRVTIARALVNDPELILADEPTSSLDDENSDLVLSLLERINRERGAAIVLTTTDLCRTLPTDADYELGNGILKPRRKKESQAK